MLQYVDPGATSLMWQLILASALGALFTLRHLIARAFRALSGLFRRRLSRDIESP